MFRASASGVAAAAAVLLFSGWANIPPEKVQLTMATLHAAALTTPRSQGDSTDTPFLVVAVIGARSSSTAILPDSGRFSIRNDQAVGARPLTELSLASGDSVQVLISVLEGASVQPLANPGAYWLGVVSLLLTNEGGSVYWRRLDCVASCKVLTAPAATALGTSQPFAGVVEFSGSGGTYHLALRANRAP